MMNNITTELDLLIERINKLTEISGLQQKITIQKCIDVAEKEGLTVFMDSDKCVKWSWLRLEKVQRCLGFITFYNKEIHIAKGDDYTCMITLLHECGHWLGRKRSIQHYGHYSFQYSSHHKEIDAYRYGWHLAKVLGAPVNKQQWRDAHSHEIATYVAIEGNTPMFTPRKEIPYTIPLISRILYWWSIGYIIICTVAFMVVNLPN